MVQAGGEEAAFTITHIGLDGTPTMVDQVSWLQANTYTPDVKAFSSRGAVITLSSRWNACLKPTRPVAWYLWM